MKKKWKQLLVVICIMACVMGNIIHVDAATQDSSIAQPLYTTIQTASAALSISGSTATATTYISAKTKCTITITMKLQKQSGSSWTTVKTWTSSKADTYVLSMSETYTVSSGTYRVYSTVTAAGEAAFPTSPSKTK